MDALTTAQSKVDPRRYHESASRQRSDAAEAKPVCIYLETTNRCNLLCTTCPRTYEELEPPADMSWELFTRIVDQVPNIARASARASSQGAPTSSKGRVVPRPSERFVPSIRHPPG